MEGLRTSINKSSHGYANFGETWIDIRHGKIEYRMGSSLLVVFYLVGIGEGATLKL